MNAPSRAVAAGALTVGAFVAGATAANGQDIGDIDRGRVYAEKVCAECHAISSTPARSAIAKATPFRVIANTPGMTSTALNVWLLTPHPSMPNLIIEGRDRDDVIAYVLSLRGKR